MNKDTTPLIYTKDTYRANENPYSTIRHTAGVSETTNKDNCCNIRKHKVHINDKFQAVK